MAFTIWMDGWMDGYLHIDLWIVLMENYGW
jgi:hypothetical protein